MGIEAVRAVWFSPTGTTARVVESVVKGMAPACTDMVDITAPDRRKNPVRLAPGEVLVIGVPVYMGRVPALLAEWFESLQGQGNPAVCVVIYGNRAYENALLELADLSRRQGCIPVGGGAYVGEHSFSQAGLRVAHGRPDQQDLEHAREFGRRVREKVEQAGAGGALSEAAVPGSFPYEGVTRLWDVDFIEVADTCTGCGHCAELCPVGAIDVLDSRNRDMQACITCCACIKRCPQQARSMKPGPVLDAAGRLHSLFADPKQPECYL